MQIKQGNLQTETSPKGLVSQFEKTLYWDGAFKIPRVIRHCLFLEKIVISYFFSYMLIT